MNDLHYRTLSPTAGSLRVRDAGGRPEAITGYAAAYYRKGDPGTEFRSGKMVERVERGAFDAALAGGEDIAGLISHDPALILGRRSAGTLRVESDEYGLRFSIPIDDTDPDHQRAVSKIRRGDYAGASMGFARPKDRWERRDGQSIRWLESVPLVEISVVAFPAYTGATVSARAEEQADLQSAFDSRLSILTAQQNRRRLALISLDG